MFRPFSTHADNAFEFPDIYQTGPHAPQYPHNPERSWFDGNMDWQREQQFRPQNGNAYVQGFQQHQSTFGFGPEAPMYMPFDDSYHNAEEDEENEDGELYEEQEPQPQANGHGPITGKGDTATTAAADKVQPGPPQSLKDSDLPLISIPGIAMQSGSVKQNPVPTKKITARDRAAELRAKVIASRAAKDTATPLQDRKQGTTTPSPEVIGSQKEDAAVATQTSQQTEKESANTPLQTEKDSKDSGLNADTQANAQSSLRNRAEPITVDEQPAQESESQQAKSTRQDSDIDLDGLLAEGRAMAETMAKQANGKHIRNILSEATVSGPSSQKKPSKQNIEAQKLSRIDTTAAVTRQKSDASIEPGEILEPSPHQEHQAPPLRPKDPAKKAEEASAPPNGQTTSEQHPRKGLLMSRGPPGSESDGVDLVQGKPPQVKDDRVQRRTPPAQPQRPEGPPVQSTEESESAATHQLSNSVDNSVVAAWLELTGFHDEVYRNRLISRHQKKRYYEQQLAELEREEDLDLQERVSLRRAQSVRPNGYGRASSVLAMPPPPLPVKEPRQIGPQVPISPAHVSPAVTTVRVVDRYAVAVDGSPAKRASSPSAYEPASKAARRESSGSSLVRHESVDAAGGRLLQRSDPQPIRPKVNDLTQKINARDPAPDVEKPPQSRNLLPSPNDDRRGMRSPSPPSAYRQHIPDRRQSVAHEDKHRYTNGRDYPTRESSPNRRSFYSHGWSGQQDPYDSRRSSPEPAAYPQRPSSRNSYSGRKNSRGRGNSYQAPRLGNHVTSFKQAGYNTPSANGGLAVGNSGGYRKGGFTRYFLIKSWNYENVEISQHESTWATQAKNTELFTEAFETCENVILVFSVNKSMAFQGYARMVSPPSPTIPPPTWVSKLLWPASPPFLIEWIVVAETPFGRIRHLRNECNEGRVVLIGRDGQEIDGECGRELCKVLAEGVREVEGRV